MTAGSGGAVAGGATQAERDALARKLAAAQGTPPTTTPAPAAPRSPAPAPTQKPPARGRVRGPRLPSLGGAAAPVQTAGGFILGLLLWGWVILPFVTGDPGGVAGVKKVWMAKFLNKTPDGTWLP